MLICLNNMLTRITENNFIYYSSIIKKRLIFPFRCKVTSSTSCSKESCLGLSSYLTPSNPSNIVMNLFCTFSSSMPSFIQLGHENYSQQFKWGLTIELQLDYAIPTVPSAFCNESKNGKHLLHPVCVVIFMELFTCIHRSLFYNTLQGHAIYSNYSRFLIHPPVSLNGSQWLAYSILLNNISVAYNISISKVAFGAKTHVKLRTHLDGTK